MKILFVNHVASLTGSAISCFNIMTRSNGDFEPIFVSQENDLLIEKLEAQNIKTYLIEQQGFLGVSSILRFLKIIKTHKIDLVHLNTLTNICKYAAIAAYIKKIPIVWVVREHPLSKRSRRMKLWLKILSSKIIFVDNDTKIKLLGEECKEKVEVIPNGVDLTYFKPEKSNFLFETYNIDSKNILIGYIGSIIKRKGVKYLIEAFYKIKQLDKPVTLVLIGDYQEKQKEYFQEIKKMVREFGIENDVYFTGVITNIKDAINSLDIVVLPSLDERCSRTLLESISCAKPVVATNIGGNPEIIKDGVNGILVEPENANQLTDALIQLIDNEELRDKFGTNGRILAENNFDINENIKKIKKIYFQTVCS